MRDFNLYKMYMYFSIFIKYINELKSGYIVWLGDKNKDINNIYSIIAEHLEISEDIDDLYTNLIHVIDEVNELSQYISEELCKFKENNTKVIELLNLIDRFKNKIYIKNGFIRSSKNMIY